VSGILPRAARHWVVDSSAINYPLGAPGRTPLYLCHPPIGALQVVTVTSPVLVGLFMEKTKNKCLSEAGTLWYISTCLASLCWGSASLIYHPRELVLPANLRTLST